MGKLAVIVHLKAATSRLQTLRLMKTLVVRAKDNGNIPYGSLQQVMYAGAESATYIRYRGIAIDARKQAIAVDNEAVGIFCTSLRSGRIPQGLALELPFNIAKVRLVDHMRGYNELPILMNIEVLDEDVLVGRPRRTRDEHTRSSCICSPLVVYSHLPHERVDNGKALTGLLYLEYTVDRKSTRLNSSHANISYAVFCLKKKKKTVKMFKLNN